MKVGLNTKDEGWIEHERCVLPIKVVCSYTRMR